MGMYASGIPMGYLVDTKGPQLAIIVGAAALGAGYYPIYFGSSLDVALGSLG
jgi:hypothetical protein